MKKLRVSHGKTILYTIVFMIVVFIAVYFPICGITFDVKSIIIIVVWVLVTPILLIGIMKTYKLEYTDKECIVTRLNRVDVYKYSDVIYIDEPYTIKHKSLTFYTKEGKLKFITLDKDAKLLDVFYKNCDHLLTREEFIQKFPTIKL